MIYLLETVFSRTASAGGSLGSAANALRLSLLRNYFISSGCSILSHLSVKNLDDLLNINQPFSFLYYPLIYHSLKL